MSFLPAECGAAAVVRSARIAGRLRLEIPALLHDPELAHRVEVAVRGRPGIRAVHASPRTARVLIECERDAPVLSQIEALAGRQRSPRARRRAGAGAMAATRWHALPVPSVLARLHSSRAAGLSTEQARARLEELGPNLVESEAPPSRLALLTGQLHNLPTVLLLGSTVVSLLLGDVLEAGAIVTVVALDAAVGYRVERTSENLLASWRVAELGTTHVIRDGSMTRVPVTALVPGDVLVLRAGDVVAADARVIDAHRLATDESALTGESEPVGKGADPVSAQAALAERRSMLYRGTRIATGRGRAVVVATADATELAAVQRLAAASHAPRAGLQRRLDLLTRKLAWSGIAASTVSAVASLAWRQPPLQTLRDTVALAVAAIPEGLPVTATAALVRAMARMRDAGIIVRKIAVAETLGGVTVACIDKTGTLTENRMQLETLTLLDRGRMTRLRTEELRAPGTFSHGPIGALLVAGILNSDIDYHHNGSQLELAGSSTERALVDAAVALGFAPRALRERWTRRRLLERGGGVHYVISEHEAGFDIIKGAPEQVAPLCALRPAEIAAVLAENAALAGAGRRVLAVGWRSAGTSSWTFGGLVGLRDPLRPGAAVAVQAAARAGIRTLMLTGDQRATAAAVARDVGLDGDVIEASELARLLGGADAANRLRRISAIARVTPADKVAVVEALRAHGECVAMAGDGINDAPALRAADVGIAVGARSSDLARQTADIVLERAELPAILTAVSEGRAVQDNLRRAIRYQIAGNLGEIALTLGASLAGRRLIPSLGLLWINLLSDTLPGLALALEEADGALLDRPPAPRGAPILDRADWCTVARDGAAIAAGSGLAAVLGGPAAAFATIGAAQFGYAAACRAPGQHREGRRFASLVGGSAALHMLAVASSPLRSRLRANGSPPVVATAFAAGLAVPLYLAWRRQADREIVRRGTAASCKENMP
jgi:Ca2+-transporting ATPase